MRRTGSISKIDTIPRFTSRGETSDARTGSISKINALPRFTSRGDTSDAEWNTMADTERRSEQCEEIQKSTS